MLAELNGAVRIEQEVNVDPEDRDYLSKRVRAELKTATWQMTTTLRLPINHLRIATWLMPHG